MTLGSRSGHGAEIRGLENAARSSVDGGRFGRLFRWLPPAKFSEDALLALAKTMIQQEFDAQRKKGEPLDTPLDKTEPEDENPTITSGFTYLGQFIDHDITFDPVSSLDRFNDPDALHDFRTPRLDLDSLYGMGPGLQPYLYEDDGVRLVHGDRKSHDAVDRFDLPRNGAAVRRALIGDKRNDENLIVSQLHSSFIAFHNSVVNELSKKGHPAGTLFEDAQRLVRWHYQWMILHQFLPAVVGEDMAKAVREGDSGKPLLRLFHPKNESFMPVEFSVAAYRFGHSMIRPSYSLNTVVRKATGATENFNRIPVFSADDPRTKPLANLNGFRELPNFWTIDWSFFFDGLQKPAQGLAIPQQSYRLDTVLVDPLAALPEFAAAPKLAEHILAFRNLVRSWRLKLPSGQHVARHLSAPLIDDEVLFADREDFDGQNRQAVLKAFPQFQRQAPLWYYILKEAELTKRKGVTDSLGGHHLGKVGGSIVAEVLTGLIWNDRNSYLRLDPTWKPEFGTGGSFTMQDLFKVSKLAT